MFWNEFRVDEVPSCSTRAWKGATAVPGGSPTLPPMPGLFDAPKPPAVAPLPLAPPPKRDPPVGAGVEPKELAGLEPKSPPPVAPPEPKVDVLVVLAVLLAPKPPKPPPVVPVLVLGEPKSPPPVPVAGAPKAGLLPKALCCVFVPVPEPKPVLVSLPESQGKQERRKKTSR